MKSLFRLVLQPFLIVLILSGAVLVLACGSWSVTSSSDPGSGTGSNSDSSYWSGWDWSWSITGSKGSFSGNAEAHCPGSLLFKPTQTTGVRTATGFEQEKVTWTSGGPGHHSAPGNAIVTGQGDGTVTCSVHMDANNWDIDAGSCAALAYGKIVFSGVCAGDVEINLNTTFAEGASTISGTLSSSPSITITTQVASDIANAQGVNTFSGTKQFTGNISGQIQKGHGTCSVLARANNGALASQATADTAISLVSLTVDDGGSISGGPCDESCKTHSH